MQWLKACDLPLVVSYCLVLSHLTYNTQPEFCKESHLRYFKNFLPLTFILFSHMSAHKMSTTEPITTDESLTNSSYLTWKIWGLVLLMLHCHESWLIFLITNPKFHHYAGFAIAAVSADAALKASGQHSGSGPCNYPFLYPASETAASRSRFKQGSGTDLGINGLCSQGMIWWFFPQYNRGAGNQYTKCFKTFRSPTFLVA